MLRAEAAPDVGVVVEPNSAEIAAEAGTLAVVGSGAIREATEASGAVLPEAGPGIVTFDFAPGATQAETLVETLNAAQGPPLEVLEADTGPALAADGPAALEPTVVPDRPLLVLHGIGGAFPDLADYQEWLRTRGIHPSFLHIDPLSFGYRDLVQSLVNSGYRLGRDLFEATYDWRVTPGPTDGAIDGFIHNANGTDITADQITDNRFSHGVDYLGYWLSQASLAWAADHGNRLPAEVDIVAHSTGGLVARVYLQSDAYGGAATITDGKLANGLVVPAGTRAADGTPLTTTLSLPRVHDLITMGVPMRGAPGPFQLSQDDWGAETAYVALGKSMAAAYELYFSGVTLAGPGNTDIPGYVEGDFYSPTEFIALYCPTLVSLTATYPFLFDDRQFRTPSLIEESELRVAFNQSAFANRLTLDLNDGMDLVYTPEQLDAYWEYLEADTDPNPGQLHRPTWFIDQLSGELTVVYSGAYDTATLMTRREEPPSPSDMVKLADQTVTPFCDYISNYAVEGQTWYTSNVANGNAGDGDGSVPIESSLGLYSDLGTGARRNFNPKLKLVGLGLAEGQLHKHVDMLSSTLGIMTVLEALDRGFEVYIVTGTQTSGAEEMYPYLKGSYNCAPPVAPDPERPTSPGLHAGPVSAVATFTSAQLGAIADGLVAMKAITLAGFAASTATLSKQIALLGRTLGSGPIILTDVLSTRFDAAAATVRALPSGTTSLALMEALSGAGLIAVGGFLEGSRNTLSFFLTFNHAVPTVSTLVLGAQAAEQGISFLTAPVLALMDYFVLNARIQIDTARPVSETFGIVSYVANQGIAFNGQGIAATAVMGSAGSVPVSEGKVAVNSYASQRFSDLSGDGRLSGAELAAAPLESVSTVEERGYAEAALPTATSDEKVIYASASSPFTPDPDVMVGSLNFDLIKERLVEVLDELAEIGDALEDPVVQTAIQVPLPFLDDPNNNTIDELLTDDRYGFGLDEFFDLVDVLRDYCDQVQDVNLRGWVERLYDALRLRLGEDAYGTLPHGPISIRGGFDVDGNGFALVIETDLEKSVEAELTEQGFGPEAAGLGLDLAIPVTAKVGFESEVTLGMDLDGVLTPPAEGITKNDVTLQVDHLRATFDLVVPELVATVTLGFLTAGIVDGAAALSTAVNFTINNGLPVTLAQLETVSPTSLVRLSPAAAGTLDVTLPLTAMVGGETITEDCRPSIVIRDDNVFDGTSPTVTTTSFECLADFCTVSPFQVLSMVKGLGDWLSQFRDSSVFATEVPFTSGTTFGTLFDFSQAFVDQIYNQLIRREIIASGAQSDSVANLGRLAFDAHFDVTVGENEPVSVTVRALDTATNASLEQLATDFNLALAASGLGAAVEATVVSGRKMALRQKSGSTASGFQITVADPDGTASTPNSDAMVAEVGFGANQFSVESPNFA
ncbi:MAG: hypothetical protein IT580_09115, partial [Verrucomicrobiales bacterium]|nr:hypothetical protein [Verrucomicrobiales bacterium]